MVEQISLRRTFLWMLIGAVGLSALLGVYVLLAGDIGQTEIKVLLTTLGVSYFSVTSLACAAAFEKGKLRALSLSGMAVGMAGFLTFLPGVWAEWFSSESYVKTMAVLAILSFSGAHACLLSLAKLDARFRWALLSAAGAIFVLAGMLCGMILEIIDGEAAFRWLGAIAILDAAATIGVPVLARLSRQTDVPVAEIASNEIEIRCPQCDGVGRYALGLTECGDCGLQLREEVADAADNSQRPTAPPADSDETANSVLCVR